MCSRRVVCVWGVEGCFGMCASSMCVSGQSGICRSTTVNVCRHRTYIEHGIHIAQMLLTQHTIHNTTHPPPPHTHLQSPPTHSALQPLNNNRMNTVLLTPSNPTKSPNPSSHGSAAPAPPSLKVKYNLVMLAQNPGVNSNPPRPKTKPCVMLVL